MAANGADPNDLVNCHFSARGLDEIRATNRSTESTDPCCQEEGMTGYDVWVAGIVIWGESASADVSCESPSRNILQLQRTLFLKIEGFLHVSDSENSWAFWHQCAELLRSSPWCRSWRGLTDEWRHASAGKCWKPWNLTGAGMGIRVQAKFYWEDARASDMLSIGMSQRWNEMWT